VLHSVWQIYLGDGP